MERLYEIDPVPWLGPEQRWHPRVRVVTESADGGRVERVLEPEGDVSFPDREEAREHATLLALRWLADWLEERVEDEADGEGG